ncbi:branched-chain amino acid ABC transporter permease [Lachnospiraceae bacterium 54-53]
MKKANKIGMAAVITAAILILPLLLPNNYIVQIVNMIGIFAIVGTGVNILTGYTGQLSLGQAAFYGIGAYTTTLLNTRFGLPFLVVLQVSILVTALFGVVLAIPALKVRGSYLALLTIGFGEIVRMVLVNWIDLTNGPAGVVGIEAPSVFGFRFDTLFKYYYLIVFFVFIGIMYQKWLMNSRTGRAFKAIRDDDKVAELTGINITEYKIRAFVLAAIYSAVAGVLYAMMVHYVSPDSFTGNDSNLFLWTAIMGGMGTVIGPVIGAVIMNILPEALRSMGDWRMVVYGIILLMVIIRYPGGITPYMVKLINYVRNKRRGKTGE